MKKIGILYICTGDYVLFWNDFYESFEKYFCKNSEIHYFIFSDKEIDFSEKENIYFHKIQHQPWPLITLLRFHTFLSIKHELQNMDYLYFFNSNMQCTKEIFEDEILPFNNKKLVFVQHPGYLSTKKYQIPYDRNKKSKAYVPYNIGGTYVIGAVEGGESEAFLSMCEELKSNINEDLKNNVIARWHDESHLNHFINTNISYRLLDSGFCYPVGFDVPFEKKIIGVSKEAKFDINKFRVADYKRKTFWQKIFERLDRKFVPFIKFIFATIKSEKIK